ncbi:MULTISPECIES: hypothetical protein [Chitinophagaceae]
MDIAALIILLSICLALIFGLPFGIASYCYRFLKLKNVPLYWRWIAVVPALGVLYVLAAILLPDRHIYPLDYIEIMAYQPPVGTTFFYGTYDQYAKHDDDFSFGIHTNYPENYRNILKLIDRRGFVKDSVTPLPDTINTYLKKNNLQILQKLSLTRYAHFDYYAVFLSDSSTIFMQKVPKKP